MYEARQVSTRPLALPLWFRKLVHSQCFFFFFLPEKDISLYVQVQSLGLQACGERVQQKQR